MHLLFAVTDTWFNTFNMNFSCSVWKLKFNILLFLSYKRSQVLEEWLLLLQFPLWNTGKNIGVYGLGTKLVFACLNSVCAGSKCVTGKVKWLSGRTWCRKVGFTGLGSCSVCTYSQFQLCRGQAAALSFLKSHLWVPIFWRQSCDFWGFLLLDEKFNRKKLRGVSKDENSLGCCCPS